MHAVEFQTVIQNGFIEIPANYQADLPAQVRVIILADKLKATENRGENIIDRLLESPRKVTHFKPMKREEIYDRM